MAIKHYANQPARPLWLLRLCPNFMSTYRGVNVNVKALEGAFDQEKALLGAFSVIVKTDCETDGAVHSTSIYYLNL